MKLDKRAFFALHVLLLGSGAAIAGREARLTVSFVNESGAPVSDAAVVVTTPNLGSYKKDLRTDSSGRVSLVLIDGDWKYIVHAEKAGLLPGQMEVQVPPGSIRNVAVTLHASADAKADGANPDDPETLFASGIRFFNTGDFRSAGAAFARATQVKRDTAKNYFWLALCEMKLKRFAESRATFQRYLRMEPSGDQAKAARELLASLPN